MKDKNYFFLLCFIIFKITIIQSSKIIKEVFPFYPYDILLEKNFEDYCLKMNLKKDCILEKLTKLDVKNLTKISYDFIKTTNKQENEEGLDKNDLKDIISSYGNDFCEIFGPIIVDGLYSLMEYEKIKLNKKNDNIIKEIEKLLNNEKYQILINEWFKEDIKKLLDDGISQIDKNLYIKDFFTKQQTSDNNFDLNSQFKANINSLNFIIFGNKNAEKSKFINNILDLKSGIDGPKENESDKRTTLIEFTKYKNNKKRGIELIESKGNETNNFKNELKVFDSYFNDKIITNENNFIYGFIYISDNDSFEEVENDLDQLYKNHYNKIPIKKVKFNNNVFSKNDFLKDILKELNEKKLKNIYKYYYSLNAFKILINKMILINQLVDIYSYIPKNEENIENIDKATNLIINKLKLNINTLLLRPNLNYDEIIKKIKSIYSKFLEELNKDIKNKNLNYTIEEDKSSINIYNYFIDNQPYNIIPIYFYEKIKILFEHIFSDKIKDIVVSYNFNIQNYPDYVNIRNDINNNFISYSYKDILWGIVILLIIIIFFMIIKYLYSFFKRNKRKKGKKNNINQKEEELVEY